jgi:hypothetical protein
MQEYYDIVIKSLQIIKNIIRLCSFRCGVVGVVGLEAVSLFFQVINRGEINKQCAHDHGTENTKRVDVSKNPSGSCMMSTNRHARQMAKSSGAKPTFTIENLIYVVLLPKGARTVHSHVLLVSVGHRNNVTHLHNWEVFSHCIILGSDHVPRPGPGSYRLFMHRNLLHVALVALAGCADKVNFGCLFNLSFMEHILNFCLRPLFCRSIDRADGCFTSTAQLGFADLSRSFWM